MALKNRLRVKAALLILALSLAVTVALRGFSSGVRISEAQDKQATKPNTINQTSALTVVETSVTDGEYPGVTIILLNQSSRNINAYVLGIGRLSVTTDFASVGDLMKPGATQIETIPLANFSKSEGSKELHHLTISAVTFQGGAGEGDAERLDALRDRHRGIREQVEQVLPVLRQSHISFSSVTLNQLHREVQENIQNARTQRSTNEGHEWVKDQLAKKIQAAKNQGDLGAVIAFYETVLASL